MEPIGHVAFGAGAEREAGAKERNKLQDTLVGGTRDHLRGRRDGTG